MFAGIAKNGKTKLYIFEGILTGEKYAEILKDFLIIEAKKIFKR